MKKLLIFVLMFLLVLSVVGSYPHLALARNYALQIEDPKDARGESDLKSIWMKDDADFLYVKFECWNAWNLISSNCCIELFLTVGYAQKPQYVLIILEDPNGFLGSIFEVETKQVTDVTVNFDKTKSIGTAQISKSIIQMKTSDLSFQFYTSVLDDPGHYYDAAPDDQEFADYIPGPNTEKPKLEVSTINIFAGDIRQNNLTIVNFNIINKGEGSLEVEFKPSRNLKLDSSQAILQDYETRNIPVTILASGLASQNYTETLGINSNFGTFTLVISFFVLPEPKLDIDKKALDFGTLLKGEKKLLKIVVSNRSKGPIDVTMTPSASWIILSKSSFQSKSEDIIVSLSSRAMQEGINEGSIKVSSNGGSDLITVVANVVLPVAIDKKEFDFGTIDQDNPKVEPIKFTLKNQSESSILVTIHCEDPWVEIVTETRLSYDEKKELTINIRPDKMTEINKSYSCEVSFETKNDKFEVPVKAYLKQSPPKILWVSDPPGQSRLEGKITLGKEWDGSCTIKNDGSGSMDVFSKLQDEKSNFRLYNAKFTLKRGESRDIKIKFDSQGLKSGIYKNTLLLESNGGNLTIPIQLEILPRPEVVIKLYIGLSYASVDDQQIKLEAAPYINKGATMVPLRFITEAFKAKIDWYPVGKGRILLSVPSKTIQIDIGSSYAYINGVKLPLQVPAEIKTGRTFVPLRFIAEGLGAKIAWKADTQQITILYTIEE